MRHADRSRQHPTRSGLGRIELLVLIFVVATITALLLPLIQRDRGTSRQTACMNNLRNLSLAVLNYTATYNGKLPLLAAEVPGTDLQANWAVTLMPLLDNASALEYVARQPRHGQAQALLHVLDNTCKLYICPDDPNHFGQKAGLSYAANIGYGNFQVAPGRAPTIEMGSGSLNADGFHAADNYSWSGEHAASAQDKTISRATGVFWLADADGYRTTMDSINNGDGAAWTVMLTENLNSGSLSTWVDGKVGGLVDPRTVGFGLGIADLGLSGTQDDAKSALNPKTLSPNVEKYWKINSNLGMSIGRYPVPSSMHAGIVNVSFCDGSAKGVADKIDLRVYGSLLTPQGVRYGELPIDGCGY